MSGIGRVDPKTTYDGLFADPTALDEKLTLLDLHAVSERSHGFRRVELPGLPDGQGRRVCDEQSELAALPPPEMCVDNQDKPTVWRTWKSWFRPLGGHQ